MPDIKIVAFFREESMGTSQRFRPVDRRTLLKTSAAIAAVQFSSPFIIKARGETPVKIGFIDPITGSLSALAQSEVEGAKWTVEEINKKGGILGRPVQLLVEDCANDTGTGVQKAHKLIERDKVDMIIGDVNSGIALRDHGASPAEKKVFHIVPGGHTDPITGKDCKWNVFRICNTTAMDATAITGELVERFGKKWYLHHARLCLWPHAAGQLCKNLKAPAAPPQADCCRWQRRLSAYLIKAKAYKPQC